MVITRIQKKLDKRDYGKIPSHDMLYCCCFGGYMNWVMVLLISQMWYCSSSVVFNRINGDALFFPSRSVAEVNKIEMTSWWLLCELVTVMKSHGCKLPGNVERGLEVSSPDRGGSTKISTSVRRAGGVVSWYWKGRMHGFLYR